MLTDQEEDDLLDEIGTTSSERIRYTMDPEARRRLEARMGAHLKQQNRENHAVFFQRYLDRRGYGPESVPVLRTLIEGYAVLTRRAVWGLIPGTTLDIGATMWLQDNPYAVITILERKRFQCFRRLTPAAVLGFPVSDIEKVAGTSRDFIVITAQFSARFEEDFIRVSCRPFSFHG